jgi:hypothetical protein
MACFDYNALTLAPLERDPFEFLLVRDFLSPDILARIDEDFPHVPGPGSHPPCELEIRGQLKAVVEELNADRFRHLVETKFAVDLSDLPTMYTVRGYLRERDGKAHTDSKTKVITVLLYLNREWTAPGGRLRLLRGDDVENFAVEIPPDRGTLLIFRRSDKSWHGHQPYVGKRRALQFNWVTSEDVVRHEQRRHAYSTRAKKLGAYLFGARRSPDLNAK